MKLQIIGHDDRFAVEQLQLQLFPDEPMEPSEQPFSADGAVSCLFTGKTWLTATAKITKNGKTVRAVRRLRRDLQTHSRQRRVLQQVYYAAAVQLLEKTPAWGTLSGVRPTKITTKHLLEGGTVRSADKLLRDTFFVQSARRKLCIDASTATKQAIARMEKQDVSLYIGIPFCPTRCAYCSFVSVGVERFSELLEPYLQALLREIEHTGKLLRDSGRRIRTLYIGGGTPTTLSTEQIKELMQAIRMHFDLDGLIEYTVEGGRPDTLDANKLRTIRTLGCDRMSINPQTMNDNVLKAIGRCHDTEQTIAAFHAAREAGFEGVNMDLIAGLPQETVESYTDSLKRVIALSPSNITVHTLAMKKGADLFFDRLCLPNGEQVEQMLQNSTTLLRAAGYAPYYLYRQKYMTGSFENVGWCKPGFTGWYNIYMMEELHTIISLGGGGMTKINYPDGHLERFHNPKFPKEYIERIDDVLQKKNEVFALLK